MSDENNKSSMVDVQSITDTRQIPIDKVGIKDIRHPVVIKDRTGKEQHTVATFNMYVSLPQQFKGTHMSRFVKILNQHDFEITVDTFKTMLSEMVEILEAEAGHIEMSFPFFVNKQAPITKIESLIDYEITFIGKISNGKPSINIKVLVPATSLCPCSKEISDYGAHNQRSHITVNAKPEGFLWVKTVLIGVDVTLPVSGGRLLLGVWQGLYLCEHRNQAGRRELVVTLNGEGF